MRKIALWHFWFVSGLDTASLALPPFLGRLRDLPAMGVWRSETWHTELLAWPSFMGRFCLGSSLLPDMQGLRFSISSPLSLVCCAQKLFFSCFIYFIQIVRLTVFITHPLLFNSALCSQGCWWRCQFSLWFGIHPFFPVLSMCVSCWKALDRASSGLPHAL